MLAFRRAVTCSSTRRLSSSKVGTLFKIRTSGSSISCVCPNSFHVLCVSPNEKDTSLLTTPSGLCTSSKSFSSFAEPNPSLFQKSTDDLSSLLAQTDTVTSNKDPDVYLRNDVRNMGALLGKIIQHHEGQEIFEKVETLRHYAKQWRAASAGRDVSKQAEATAALDSMVSFASSLTDQELFLVSRAFTHFLAICNAAEAHHRSRRVREDLLLQRDANDTKIRALRDTHDSCGRVFANLVASGIDKRTIHDSVCSQTVEFVLTAHPTEVNRRTLLDKKKRMLNLLEQADIYRAMGGATPYQRQLVDDAMEREVSGIWQSDEVSRRKPKPQTEAQRGTLVVETVLWEAVPSFLRKLDATLKNDLGEEYGLPLHVAPIRFASWMGGDRDGNPNVTPQVTREVCLSNRLKAAQLFKRDLQEIFSRLSISNCSDELRSVVGTDVNEPYRVYLAGVIAKLSRTEEWAKQALESCAADTSSVLDYTPPPSDVYLSKSEFMNDMLLVRRSLYETENGIIADGLITDLIRNISAFGLTLCPLDIRQESDRHAEAMDSIARFLGVGSYEQWDEPTRIHWLTQQLASTRPLLRAGEWHAHPEFFSPTSCDTLDTFQMIAQQYEDSLGAYVISQATYASDVLAVLLLQRDAGVKKPLRVVPLFETLDDLNGAAKTVDQLFSLPTYRGSIDGKQEIMIGYSDSAKDAGRLAASWAQFKTQEQLVQVARKHGIDMTFFHGKGGTVGRGGNPETFKAILAHAPNTINGQFRVTEQGEMIDKNFGVVHRAERTLDIYTAAVLAEQHTPRPTPTSEWRNMMEQLSQTSCAAYRRIVREDPRFVPYFRSATPELELGSLNIGSRPAKRKASGGVESLRAIPWIFAWTQTRLNLPTWLGVGEALSEMLNDDAKSEKLRAMYNEWDSFKTTIDLVEMVLAKSEPVIAKHYDTMLVKDAKAQELGEEIRSIHQMTEDTILNLSNHKTLGENNKLLGRALNVRNPYVDALNIMQAETLKRVRAAEENGTEESQALKDALQTTITGIANGMGNTG